MLYNRIKSGRIFLLISGFFSFYYDFVGKADDPSSGAVNCLLLHAEMIRNVLSSGVGSRYTAVTAKRIAAKEKSKASESEKNSNNCADTADSMTSDNHTEDNTHPDTENSTTGDQEQ